MEWKLIAGFENYQISNDVFEGVILEGWFKQQSK